MPWPTGTSTAGLRVATDGILPPKPATPPPPPPKRRIRGDGRPGGKIVDTSISPEGIIITLDVGRKMMLPFTVFGPEDISRVDTGRDKASVSLVMRNGDILNYSLLRIQALTQTFEERESPE